MSENSKIEWCDHTFNPWRGCTKISPGCANCYAAREAIRFPGIRGVWGNCGTRIVAVPDAWTQPLRWNRKAGLLPPVSDEEREWHRPRVFCASLADVFEDWKGELRFPAAIALEGFVRARWDGHQLIREIEATADAQGLPLATMDNAREELFRLIDATPNLDWLLLTKRPENVMRMVPDHWRGGFPQNVWMGTTVEDQEMADKRIPELLGIPAMVRFLSCEPLLSFVDIQQVGDDELTIYWPLVGKAISDGMNEPFTLANGGIHWVIAGGESGPGCRPFDPEWARSLRDQCQAAGVPFFMKQMGGTRKPFEPIPDDLMIREFPKGGAS